MQKNRTEHIKAKGWSKLGGSSETERQEKRQSLAASTSCTWSEKDRRELDHRLRGYLPISATLKSCLMIFDHSLASKGDPQTLEAIGTGAVEVKLKLPGRKLEVGRLSCSLRTYPGLQPTECSEITEAGMTVMFGETQGKGIDGQREVFAVASKARCLYYLNCTTTSSMQLVISPRRNCSIRDLVREACVC